jgi:NAD+ kinase
MEAFLLTPLCPHALAARPLLLPADCEVRLELTTRSDPAVLNLDGQKHWPMRPGRPVTISRAGYCMRLVVPRTKTYFQVLRDKLKWSGSQV